MYFFRITKSGKIKLKKEQKMNYLIFCFWGLQNVTGTDVLNGWNW